MILKKEPADLQTTFNTDSIEDLIEEGEVENVYKEDNKACE